MAAPEGPLRPSAAATAAPPSAFSSAPSSALSATALAATTLAATASPSASPSATALSPLRRRRVRLAASGWTQFRLLLRRSFKEVARSRGVLAIKIVQQVAISLIYGSIYTVGRSQARLGAGPDPIALPFPALPPPFPAVPPPFSVPFAPQARSPRLL